MEGPAGSWNLCQFDAAAATPEGNSLVRCSVSAAHTQEQMDQVGNAFSDLGRLSSREQSPAMDNGAIFVLHRFLTLDP